MKRPTRIQSAIIAACGMVVLTGCGGLRASKSISPLDFILPGLVGKPQPPEATPAPAQDPAVPVLNVASVR